MQKDNISLQRLEAIQERMHIPIMLYNDTQAEDEWRWVQKTMHSLKQTGQI